MTFHQNLSTLDASYSKRVTFIPLDVTIEENVQNVAEQVERQFGKKSVKLLINSSGYLLPEKAIKHVHHDLALQHFHVNTIGPLLMAKHFSGLLASPSNSQILPHSVWVNMSARTGSIGDNHLGGWYSYRMSKAALNQLTKTLGVEIGRKGSIAVSLHPGTVDTDLSRQYTKNVKDKMSPDESVVKLLKVIFELKVDQNGGFLDYNGLNIPY